MVAPLLITFDRVLVTAPGNGSFITKVAVSARPLGIATVVQPVVSGPQRVMVLPWILVADISRTMLRQILSCTTGTWFFFPYCDGGFFTGNNANVSEYQGNKLYFRGFRNEIAYFQHLSANRNLMQGTDFVIGGCSAGGLATFFHLDWWRERLPAASAVKGLPDSGWILDYNAGLGPGLRQQWLWIYNNMNSSSGLDQSCVAAHVPTRNVEECMFIETTTLHVTTPLFPLQSQYDTWQIQNVLGSNNVDAINAFGKLFEARFKTGVLWNANNGCFLDSCAHHCGYWNSITIDNTNAGNAFRNWYTGQKGQYFQGKVYPCNACCSP